MSGKGKNEWEEDLPTVESDLGVFFVESGSRGAMLEQVEGPGSPRKVPLQGAQMVVGRAQTADIRIDSVEVSRTHMRLRKVGDEHVVEDLESRNGIYLNGVKIHSATLRDGDSIQLGNVVFVYREGK